MGCWSSTPAAPKTAEEIKLEQIRVDVENTTRDRAIAEDAERKWPVMKPAVEKIVWKLCQDTERCLLKMAEDDTKWWRVQVQQYSDHGPVVGYLVRREFERWLTENRYEYERIRAKYLYYEQYYGYHTTYGTEDQAAYQVRKLF